MVSNQLVLAGIVAFATVTPTSAQFGLGDLMKNVGDMMENLEVTYTLGEADEDLEAMLNGIFADMSGWLDSLGDFNTTEVFATVDTAIEGASQDILNFGNTFENVFKDVSTIPEQYAYFLKDTTIDVAALANEVFSSEAIKAIPDDVAALFSSMTDGYTTGAFDKFLEVPSMVVALKNAGVDTDLMTATAEIGNLFAASTTDAFFKAVDFSKASIADVQKAVAAMTPEAQNTFKTAMKASRTGNDVALGAAWTAVLANDELAKELNANNVDTTKLKTAAAASTAKVQADIIAAQSGASTATAGAAAVALVVALAF